MEVSRGNRFHCSLTLVKLKVTTAKLIQFLTSGMAHLVDKGRTKNILQTFHFQIGQYNVFSRLRCLWYPHRAHTGANDWFVCFYFFWEERGHTKQVGEIKKLLHIAEKLTAALHGLIFAKVLSGFQAPVLCVITQL